MPHGSKKAVELVVIPARDNPTHRCWLKLKDAIMAPGGTGLVAQVNTQLPQHGMLCIAPIAAAVTVVW